MREFQNMTMLDYQFESAGTAIYPGQGELSGLMYVALGASGEVGEIANRVKKLYRDDATLTDGDVVDIMAEVGDVLWYLARIADEVGFNLDEAAQYNLDKLASRQARGALGGSGDNR